MHLAIGADHRGSETARRLADHLLNHGHEIDMIVPPEGTSCDYPEPAWRVATKVASGDIERGILFCGTGIGVSIAANKVKGIRAAVVHDEITAELSRGHNDANVICLSADLLGHRLIEKIIDLWLATRFEGGRHERRNRKIDAIENGLDPTKITE